MIKNGGITLIALVITIILLLILAGVSIAILTGDNGILTRAGQSKDTTQVAKEKEGLSLLVTYYKMVQDQKLVGEKLYDRNIANSNIWSIVVNHETNESYGTDWYYIPKNTNLENYGLTENDWIINYHTGEMIKIDDKNYSKLSYDMSLAVKEGLIFNIDPSNINHADSWGNGVTLNGFDQSSLNDKVISLDGIDDYITIDGNMEVEDGITLEFYGNIKGNIETPYYGFVPLFSAYNNVQTSAGGYAMRMYMLSKNSCINFGYASCGNSSIWESENAKQNIHTITNMELNKDFMITVTYDHNTLEFCSYFNGTQMVKEPLIESYWENFKKNDIPKIENYQIGKTTWNAITGYLKGDIYSVRIYNKALTGSEVSENYNKTVAYFNTNQ